MTLFLIGIAILVIGYFLYGPIVEAILQVDSSRETPAIRLRDGVDFVELPCWKNMLIQLLNIAGIGPVIGVIVGIKFGTIVFVIIPIGCVLMGATHDFVAGMMSLRNDGANLPELVRRYTNKCTFWIFSIVVSLALIAVVTVFINVPANLIINKLGTTNGMYFFWIAAAIFVYYIIATLFPVDKVIGKVYLIFGGILLLGTVALFISLMISGFREPQLLEQSAAFTANMFTPEKNQPIIPLLFVTIACGILSGFHATQAPIIARTMKNEGEAKASFFGMMIVEGFIAMVWAAGALAIYNKFPELMKANPNGVLVRIADTFLYRECSTAVVIGVVILAITSGDTAMRSLRMSLAETLHFNQREIWRRIAIVLPLIAIVAAFLVWSNRDSKSFNVLWNYFAWTNQLMAVFTLAIGTVFLTQQKRAWFVTALPGLFISTVVCTYILWASPAHGGVCGFGLSLEAAIPLGAFLAVIIIANSVWRGLKLREQND